VPESGQPVKEVDVADSNTTAQVVIDRIDSETIQVPIIGTTPLIMHRFAEKAKRQMLDAMQGKKTPKQSKDPEAEYQGAFYRLKGDSGYGLPAVAFKQSMVGATRFFGKDVSMVLVRQTVFVHGDVGEDGQMLVTIEGEPHMREDVVTVGRGGHDLRYRPEFPEWRADLRITYVRASFTRGSVLSLLDAAGMGVGVGEWRPEKNGDFGQFTIDETREVEVLSS
jgi:hypothetical protein